MKHKGNLINNRCLPLSLVLGLVFLLSFYRTFGQQSLKGTVTDAGNGLAIAGAAIFIDNSTFGTVCDEKGNFVLERFPQPPFQLKITAVGYETGSLEVNSVNLTPLVIKLKQKPQGLAEVMVMGAEKDGWQKYGKQFIMDFIGYSPFAAQCTILNKEVLQFRYDQADNLLKAWAEKPLLIRNEATGYLITYWLEDYKKEYGNQQLFFKGYTRFTPLESKKEKKRKEWEENRRSAYSGSLNHFMRTLCLGTTSADGFIIRKMERVVGYDYSKYTPVWTDTVQLSDSAQFNQLFRKIYTDTASPLSLLETRAMLLKWQEHAGYITPVKITPPSATPGSTPDSEYLFIKNQAVPEKTIVNCYSLQITSRDSIMAGKMGIVVTGANNLKRTPMRQTVMDMMHPDPVNIDTFLFDRYTNKVQLRFPGYLFITYTHEREEAAYLQQRGLAVNVFAGVQASILSLRNENGITVFANGNFAASYDVLVEDYWAYEKLDKLLPLDYNP